MHPLQALADKHPVTTGLLGTAGGVTSWALSTLHSAGDIAGDLGKIFGAGVAILTFMLLYNRLRDRRYIRREEIQRYQQHDDDRFP